jgi:CRP-like cAMP-binding protein
VVKSATEAWAETGEAIVTRWQGTRHFYTVVSGTAEVRNDTQVLREMGPGDYFGELAALDWGAGFGYARTAHVVATSPLRLLVLVPSALTELLKRAPDLDRRLRAAAREHVRSL